MAQPEVGAWDPFGLKLVFIKCEERPNELSSKSNLLIAALKLLCNTLRWVISYH